MNKVLKIVQVNKGDSYLYNRTEQINDILNEHKPHLMIINELNVHLNDNITKNSFGIYKLETDNLEVVDKLSRTGILVHPDIKFKRRRDLESQGTSTIWLQLSHPGRKSVLIQAAYRQFQRLGQQGSETPKCQEKRWDLILRKWESAMTEGKEIISLGDFNLNTLRWDIPFHEKTSYEKQQNEMVQNFKQFFLEKGFKILNNQPTRTKDNVEPKPACLDLIISNNLSKVSSFKSGISSFSDHSLQILCRSVKDIKSTPKFIRTRTFKNFNVKTYQDNIINHKDYIEVHYEQDPSIITSKIQGIIKDSLETMAPIKRVQVSSKNSNKFSEEIRQAIADRDIAHERAKSTKDIEETQRIQKYQKHCKQTYL